MTKVLLVQPNYSFWLSKVETFSCLPLGIIYIGTVLEEKHDVKIHDRNIDNDDSNLARVIKKFNPDIVGISTMTGVMLNDALQISRVVRENSDAKTIWGGVHPTLRPESTLKHPLVDYIVRGEGELVMLDIADRLEKGKDISDLKNVNLNPMREFVDLNKIPFPNYGLVEVKKYASLDISTSRGCPYRCTFCYNQGFWWKMGMKRIRSYTPENTIRLITELTEKYKQKRVMFHDDEFTINRKRVLEVCKGISDLDLRFFCYCRSDHTTDEIMRALKRAGCWTVQIGFESGSQRMLDFMKKDITVEQSIHAIKQCRKFGIFCEGSFMIGLPTETIDDLRLTVKFIHKYPPDVGGPTIFHPYPSTELYDYCIEHNLTKEPRTLEEWARYNIRDTTNVNVSEIPDDILIKVYNEIGRKLMITGYTKKFIGMVKDGYIAKPKNIVRAGKHIVSFFT